MPTNKDEFLNLIRINVTELEVLLDESSGDWPKRLEQARLVIKNLKAALA